MGNKQKETVNCVMIGLDSSGKTAMLYQLKNDTFEGQNLIPTIGPNEERFIFETNFCKIRLDIWDLGGMEKIRSLWRHYPYNSNKNAIIIVIDSDPKQFERIRKNVDDNIYDEMVRYLNEFDYDIPILIWCNKQDLKNAVTIQQIECELGLTVYDKNMFKDLKCVLLPTHIIDIIFDYINIYNKELGMKRRKYKIMGCSAKTGDGVYEGIEWITNQYMKYNVKINKNTKKKSFTLTRAPVTDWQYEYD
eukprot:407479_1